MSALGTYRTTPSSTSTATTSMLVSGVTLMNSNSNLAPSKKKQIEKTPKQVKPQKAKSVVIQQRTSFKIGQRINSDGVVEQQQQQQQQQQGTNNMDCFSHNQSYYASSTSAPSYSHQLCNQDQPAIAPIYSNRNQQQQQQQQYHHYHIKHQGQPNLSGQFYDSNEFFLMPRMGKSATATSNQSLQQLEQYSQQLPQIKKKQISSTTATTSYDHEHLPIVRRSSSSSNNHSYNNSGGYGTTNYTQQLVEQKGTQVHRLEQPSMLMPISMRSLQQQAYPEYPRPKQHIGATVAANGLNFTFREQEQKNLDLEYDDILPYEFPANQSTNPNDLLLHQAPQVKDRFGNICSFLDKSLSKHSSIASQNSNHNSSGQSQQQSEESLVARLPTISKSASSSSFKAHAAQQGQQNVQGMRSQTSVNVTNGTGAMMTMGGTISSLAKFNLSDSFVLKKHGHYTDEYESVSAGVVSNGQDSNSATSQTEKDGKRLIMLGKGGFGQVFLIKQKLGAQEERAMKIIPKCFQEAFREVMMLKQFSHPNVLKIYEYYEDESNLYVITERCYGYNLFDYIILKGQFTEFETCKIADGVLRALAEAHKQHIVHRDVKPDNIMLDFNVTRETFNVKLIDWGLADSLLASDTKYLSKRCGTLHYLAPEVLSKRYNEKADLWSLGMVLFTLIQGSPPICGKSQANILEQVQAFECSFKYSCWNAISDDAKNLISRLLERDPAKRISAVEALRHPWFSRLAGAVVIDTQDLRSSFASLVKYSQANTFKKTILGFFASHLISKRERDRFLSMFSVLDADKDGELSVQELKSGFAKLFTEEEFALCSSEIESIFYSSLSSKFKGTNGIKYEEFLSSMLDCSATYSQEALKQAFALFDRENTGLIQFDEILRTLELPFESEAAQSFYASVHAIDINNNGVLDFEYFSKIMQHFLDQNSQVILSQEFYLQ